MKIAFLYLVAQIFYTAPIYGLEEKHEHTSHPHAEESHDDPHEDIQEASSNVGPGRAITAADSENGIQLAPAAAQRIGLELAPVTGVSVSLPAEAIVRRRDKVGVYRWREGWIKFIPGTVAIDRDRARFSPEKTGALQSGDQVAIAAVGLITVAELDAFSSGEGHGH